MTLEYFADTDSLSITFRDQPSVDSQEISAGVVIDYDADGGVVGNDIDNASHKVDLTRLDQLPPGSAARHRAGLPVFCWRPHESPKARMTAFI